MPYYTNSHKPKSCKKCGEETHHIGSPPLCSAHLTKCLEKVSVYRGKLREAVLGEKAQKYCDTTIQLSMESVELTQRHIIDTFCMVVEKGQGAFVPVLLRLGLDNLAFLQDCQERGYRKVSEELLRRIYDGGYKERPTFTKRVNALGKRYGIENLGDLYRSWSRYVHVGEHQYANVSLYSPFRRLGNEVNVGYTLSDMSLMEDVCELILKEVEAGISAGIDYAKAAGKTYYTKIPLSPASGVKSPSSVQDIERSERHQDRLLERMLR